MAKNKVASERSFRPRKDNFFAKAKPDFKAKNKVQKQKPHRKPDTLESASGDFFIKPAENKGIEHKNDLKKLQKSFGKDKDGSKAEEKKTFDKKLWRLQKYSKKYKLQQWEDNRKKQVLKGYYRSIKEDQAKLDVKKIYEQDDEAIEENENNLNADVVEEVKVDEEAGNSQQRKAKARKKAHLEFERIKEEKLKKKEAALKAKEERAEALKEYKKKKAEKFRKLNKRTKKGQPIMKDRMEMLLEQIQKNLE